MALDQPEDENLQDVEMGFLDHLEELRKRLFWSAAFILTGGIALFIAKDWLFETVLFGPRRTDFISFKGWCWISNQIGAGDALCVREINYELINTTMLGNFSTHILVSAIGGFILSFPLVFWQGWLFLRPALKDRERQAARGIGLSSSLLFFLGVAFGYLIIAPLSLQFLGNYELGDVQARISVMSYMKTIASITMACRTDLPTSCRGLFLESCRAHHSRNTQVLPQACIGWHTGHRCGYYASGCNKPALGGHARVDPV